MARVLIVLLGVTIYSFALGGEWIYDDYHSIVNNPNIRSLWQIPYYFFNIDMFSANPQWGMYRPILLATYALNYHFSGYNFIWWQVVNVSIHIINSLLVYWVVSFYRKDVALWSALLFTVHPLASEPVNYISSRSDLLAGTFWLLTMGFSTKGWHRYGVGSLVLGVMTKENLATLPLLIKSKKWLYYAPVIALMGLFLWLGNVQNSVTDTPRSWGEQFLVQLQVVYESTVLLIAPFWLSIEHRVVLTWWKMTIGAWIIAGLFWLYYFFDEYRKYILWITLPLVVTTIIPMNILVSERRLYLSIAPVCVLLAMQIPRYYLVLLGITLSLFTLHQNTVWDSAESVWQSATRADSLAARPHLELGMVNIRKGQRGLGWGNAENEFRQAVVLDKDGTVAPKALNNLGALYMQQKRFDEAQSVFGFLFHEAPNEPGVLANLGVLAYERGDYGDAEGWLLKSLELFPNDPDVWANLALTYVKLGNRDKANETHARAVALRP